MKLLFSAINCTLDSSNGAAISIRTFLRFLSRHGVECMSISASVYDKPTPGTPLENITATGALPVYEPGLPQTLWMSSDEGVHHYVEFGDAMEQKRFKPEDEQRLYNRTLRILDTFQPDVLLLYGGRKYERSLLRKARERGIATVFYLVNPSYRDERNFENVDMVFTDSHATKDLFDERFGFDCKVIGKFIEKPSLPADLPPAQLVTFINPAPEKGVTLFLRIAQLAAQTLPQARFLVVESRSLLSNAEQRTGLDASKFGNVRRVGLQRDMGAVYGMTKVLLVPSLWHDSGPRVSVEALSMGIPTLVSNRGGLPELVGEGGIVIDPPPPLVAQHWLVPPIRDAIPWVEVLRQLLTDPELYAEHRAAALRMWETHNPDRRMPMIIGLFEEAIAKARTKPAP
jgi:glycosyltransferase involved in cell wall biosynthesis